ncbi:Guanine nucleotide-binding protein G(k) subunit alpha [Balamuthia mandrillaris]
MLRVRKKTTGVIETKFESGGLNFRMVDVGGQRNERKKWIHCFEFVTAVIFVVSLSEYDMVLEEAEDVNRMHESLNLFADIINNRWFINTSIILFLNKKDLFEKKITHTDLNVCFPDYKGGKNYDSAVKYIEKQFLKRNRAEGTRFVYTHVTCATDTENVRVVFNAMQEIFLTGYIQDAGF